MENQAGRCFDLVNDMPSSGRYDRRRLITERDGDVICEASSLMVILKKVAHSVWIEEKLGPGGLR